MERKMDNEMEIRVCLGVYMRVILGLYWDNGKENGNYYSILGLYWDK